MTASSPAEGLRQSFKEILKLKPLGNIKPSFYLSTDIDVSEEKLDDLIKLVTAYAATVEREALEALDTEMQKYIDCPVKEKTPFTHALKQARLGQVQMQRLVKARLAALQGPPDEAEDTK